MAWLLGLGTAVPEERVTRDEALAAARVMCAEDDDHARVLETLYEQSGVESRYVSFPHEEVEFLARGQGTCDSPFIPSHRGGPGPSTAARMRRYEQQALPLALAASRAALAAAGLSAGAISHVVTASCTGFAAPGVDLGLIRELGLPRTSERVHVGFMGCHGAFNALRVARGLRAAEPSARVLLCTVELCSLHYAYGWNPRRIVGNALFADGAAAVVLGPSAGISHRNWRLRASGSCVFPDCEQAMSWRIGDHGFDMALSSRVPSLIQQHLRGFLEAWLESQGLGLGNIGSWAVHPGGPRVLGCIQQSLGLDADELEVSRGILARYGNMSSATVLFILQELMARGAPLPCVALGFGPGLCVEVALFTGGES